MWLISALLSALLAALVSILAKLGLKTIDSTLVTIIRAVVMTIFLLLFGLATNKFSHFSFSVLGSRDWGLVLLSGLAGALSWLFYFFALKIGSASKVSAIDRLSLVFVILFSGLFLGEKITWRMISGALLMILGALLISWR